MFSSFSLPILTSWIDQNRYHMQIQHSQSSTTKEKHSNQQYTNANLTPIPILPARVTPPELCVWQRLFASVALLWAWITPPGHNRCTSSLVLSCTGHSSRGGRPNPFEIASNPKPAAATNNT